jgi:hypothetical protein
MARPGWILERDQVLDTAFVRCCPRSVLDADASGFERRRQLV